MEISSTEVQNNFGTYLKLAQVEDVFVTRNGKRIAVIKYWEEPHDDFLMAAESRTLYKDERPRMSVEDFRKLSEASDNRYELIDGEVYQLASPSWEHQRIVAELLHQLMSWSKGKKCKPVTAPFDVTLFRDDVQNILQPDIVVVCDVENVNDKGRYSGTPTLVVEVLSDSTRNRDMVKKLNVYLAGGIKEYWIANPEGREIYIYAFESGEIQNYRVFKGVEIACSEALNGLEIPLGNIFNG